MVKKVIDLGVFAHNEEDEIARFLTMLAMQDVFADDNLSVRVLVLANGCRDNTVAIARQTAANLRISENIGIHELPQGGKSRTWNAFVHDLSRQEADILVFCDADIDIPSGDTLRRLVEFLQRRPDLVAASSRPVKDIAINPPEHPSLGDRIIAGAGGTLNDWQTSICGQLYLMQSAIARGFHLPVGLPVEDGFVRAMITTSVLRALPDNSLLSGDPALFHVYRSERTIPALLRHQSRIVIGSAINTVLFDVLSRASRPADVLADVSSDADWLERTLRSEMPRWYGYIPFASVTKRFRRWRYAVGAKAKALLFVGVCFDAVVYVIAQFEMFRGKGAGYW